MRISNPFRYMYRQPYKSVTCLFKLHFGTKKYWIYKALALHNTVNQVSVELDRRLRLGADDESVYSKIVKHIHRARVAVMEVEVIFETDNPAELLIQEYKLLQVAAKDPECLNTSFEPHIPKWVPQTAVAQYEAFKRSLQEQRRNKTAKKKSRSAGARKTPIPAKKVAITKKKAAAKKSLRPANPPIDVKSSRRTSVAKKKSPAAPQPVTKKKPSHATTAKIVPARRSGGAKGSVPNRGR